MKEMDGPLSAYNSSASQLQRPRSSKSSVSSTTSFSSSSSKSKQPFASRALLSTKPLPLRTVATSTLNFSGSSVLLPTSSPKPQTTLMSNNTSKSTAGFKKANKTVSTASSTCSSKSSTRSIKTSRQTQAASATKSHFKYSAAEKTAKRNENSHCVPVETFMERLNRNALIIQRWYHAIMSKRNQSLQNKISDAHIKNTPTQSFIKESDLDNQLDNSESKIRRQKLANAARQEIIQEMAMLQKSESKPLIAPSVEPCRSDDVVSPVKAKIPQQQKSVIDTEIFCQDLPAEINTTSVYNAEAYSAATPISSVYDYNYDYEDETDFKCTDEYLAANLIVTTTPPELKNAETETTPKLDSINSDTHSPIIATLEPIVIRDQFDVSNDTTIFSCTRPTYSTHTQAENDSIFKQSLIEPKSTLSNPSKSLDRSRTSSYQSITHHPSKVEYKFEVGHIPSSVSNETCPTKSSTVLPLFHSSTADPTPVTPSLNSNSVPSNTYRLNLTEPCRSYIQSSVSLKSNSTINDSVVSKQVDRILGLLKDVDMEDNEHDKRYTDSTLSVTNTIESMSEFLKNPSHITAAAKGPAEQTAAVFDGVKAKILGQQMEIEEKSRMVDLLKTELKKTRDTTVEQFSQHQKTLKSQLSLQRKEYETIVKRHLGFIDKLLAEKEELSKKCEELTADVKQMEKQFAAKMKTVEEQQARDIKQQRDMWQAAEKIKRDKWIQDKTKSIKDQTVKGLEPEIQRMIAQHKAQVLGLEEKSREQFIKEKNLLIEQHQRQLDSLRDRSVAERQKACEDEREFGRQRYLKQLERDEMEFQQQKRKLCAEFDEQKHNLLKSFKEERNLDDQTHRKAIEDLRYQIESDRVSMEQDMSALKKKHEADLKLLQEKMQVEKEEWQDCYIKKMEADIRTKEKSFKDKLIKERDAELEMIIQRLESENNSSSSDVTRKYRMDMERLKAETADEIKHLRDQHSMALDKVLSAQNTICQLEEHRRQLQKEVLKIQHETCSKEATIRQQKSELARLKVDEETLMNTIRGEFHDQIDTKERAILLLNEQTEVLQRKYQHELSCIMKDKEETMMHIEERVRQTLRHKDDMIASLKAKQDELTFRNGQLESMIEKQRQELLS
ncbi:hypothetical protein QVD99_000724 [Batrachochytrium dendrobatidis]|nr:hypothetical protein O5D80_003574 [Batrachochytrium dendrobatidis]KAK5673269.1 hypothetical protein QVD99_000724 [Batrachochytrium dendrobatidis]